MKSVLIATDFIYKADGTLTPTEINTDSSNSLPLHVKDFGADAFLINFGNYFDHVEFNQFLIDNGFNKIITIDKKNGSHRVIESFCAYYNIQYEFVEVPANSITIPEVTDDTNTLIIRIAYDTYALIDDLYARDMYEFHNLIKNESFASPVSFNMGPESNLDTISTFEGSQNGIIPNYVVKPRVPGYPKYSYPKLFRFDNESELQQLKESITANEFIQKYEYNSDKLVQNRTSFIRSIDLVYGPNLDTVHLISYKLLNMVSTQNALLVYDNEIDTNTKKLDNLFSAKWYPSKFIESGLSYHFDNNDEILLANDTLVKGSDITTSDIIKTITFTEDIRLGHTGSISDLTVATIGDSTIKAKTPPNMEGVFVNFTVKDSNGNIFKWFDGIGNVYLISANDSNFVQYNSVASSNVEIGDTIYAYDRTIDAVEPLEILDIFYDLKPSLDLYAIELESENQFLVKFDSENVENPKTLYLIQHNYSCDAWCGVYYYCYDNPICDACGKGSSNCPNCGGGSGYFCNSDSRYKKNITKIGQSLLGFNIYNFEYINEPNVIYQGVIAQELIGTEYESALKIDENGYYSVDYSKIDVEFLKIN